MDASRLERGMFPLLLYSPAALIPPSLIIIFFIQGQPDSSSRAKARSHFALTHQTSVCFHNRASTVREIPHGALKKSKQAFAQICIRTY